MVWLSAKKGVSEYLIKQPGSNALPSVLGRQPRTLLSSIDKQSKQVSCERVSAHCAKA